MATISLRTGQFVDPVGGVFQPFNPLPKKLNSLKLLAHFKDPANEAEVSIKVKISYQNELDNSKESQKVAIKKI